MREIVFRSREPILHRQEIGAHILSSARNKAQNFRNALQHLQLPRTGFGFVASIFGFATA